MRVEEGKLVETKEREISGRKEQNLVRKEVKWRGFWMSSQEWKDGFMKYNISRNENSIGE